MVGMVVLMYSAGWMGWIVGVGGGSSPFEFVFFCMFMHFASTIIIWVWMWTWNKGTALIQRTPGRGSTSTMMEKMFRGWGGL